MFDFEKCEKKYVERIILWSIMLNFNMVWKNLRVTPSTMDMENAFERIQVERDQEPLLHVGGAL